MSRQDMRGVSRADRAWPFTHTVMDKTIGVKLPSEVLAQIMDIAETERRSMSQVVRLAIEEFLTRRAGR